MRLPDEPALETAPADERPELATVVAMQRPALAALARAWLAAGASAFGVTVDGHSLAAWPRPDVQLAGGLVAPVMAGEARLGELRVAGQSGAVAETRLAADAALIAQLAQHESELDGIAEELVQTQDQLLALYDLARAARSQLSLPDTLASLARETTRLVDTDGAGVIFAPVDGELVLGSHGAVLPEAETLLDAYRRRSADDHARVPPRPGAAPYLTPDDRNILLVPIRIRAAKAAALVLLRAEGRAPFASPEIKLAHAIAEQAGSQIENVLLYEETLARARLETEMALARTVQMRLLPVRAPEVPGLALHARSTPALQVGGDFYDFIVSSDRGARRCTFSVGDVSGKGLSAALVMTMVRTMLRSQASHHISPAQVLDAVNSELYDDFTEVAMFATAFVAQYDADTHELRYANAGHSPVIYCPVGGPARLLEADGTAVGVLPFSLCQDYQVPFGPGALLLVGSDGLSEASNAASEMYGYDRLLALAESLADQPAEAIADAVFAAVGDYAAGHLQEDDRTLIVAKGVVS